MDYNTLEDLRKTVLKFDYDNAETVAMRAIGEGIDPLKCSQVVIESIGEIGEKFTKGEMYLVDIVCASEVLKRALPIINEEIMKQGKKAKTLGKVVIGTVFGDIHNIGKDMVATLLYASGFEVIDLGVNVKEEDFLKAIKESKADILAMSALLTTTIMELKNVIDKLIKEKIRNKIIVIVGGAPLDQECAEKIGADAYGATAVDGVEIIKKLISVNQGG